MQKFHRDLPPTPVYAYGVSEDLATVPGPTIEALQGIDINVTWQNHLPPKHILPWDATIPTAIPANKLGIPTVVHLHGGIVEPESMMDSQAHGSPLDSKRRDPRGPNKHVITTTNNKLETYGIMIMPWD